MKVQPSEHQSYWGLQLLLLVGERFEAGGPPPTIAALAERLELPLAEANALLELLQDIGALRASGENGFEVLPARDMKHLTVFDMVERLEQRVSVESDAAKDGYGKVAVEVLDLVRQEGRGGIEGLTMADLLVRAKEKLEEDGIDPDEVTAEADEISNASDEPKQELNQPRAEKWVATAAASARMSGRK